MNPRYFSPCARLGPDHRRTYRAHRQGNGLSHQSSDIRLQAPVMRRETTFTKHVVLINLRISGLKQRGISLQRGSLPKDVCRKGWRKSNYRMLESNVEAQWLSSPKASFPREWPIWIWISSKEIQPNFGNTYTQQFDYQMLQVHYTEYNRKGCRWATLAFTTCRPCDPQGTKASQKFGTSAREKYPGASNSLPNLSGGAVQGHVPRPKDKVTELRLNMCWLEYTGNMKWIMNDVLRCHGFRFLWCFQARFLNLLCFRAVCGPFTFKVTSWQDGATSGNLNDCFVWFQLFHLFLWGLRESPILDSPNATASKLPRFWTLHKWLLRYILHKGRSIGRYLSKVWHGSSIT